MTKPLQSNKINLQFLQGYFLSAGTLTEVRKQNHNRLGDLRITSLHFSEKALAGRRFTAS